MGNELVITSFLMELEDGSAIVIKEEDKDYGTTKFVNIFNYVNYSTEDSYDRSLTIEGEDTEFKINLDYISNFEVTETNLGIKVHFKDTILSIEML